MFTEIITAGFDLLTYYKGSWVRAAVKEFTTVDYTAADGSSHSYALAERPIELAVPGQRATANQDATEAALC